ncbi:MAG: SDR family oxidoreductase [Candidatus Zixiibacteriota bacterium]
MTSLKDKVVVITGASRGIGAATARLFANEQVKLVICGRDRKRLKEVGESLGLQKSDYLTVIADVARASGMKKIVHSAYRKFGRIDIFVNNAGVGVRKEIEKTSEKEFIQTFDTNVKAIFHAFHELVPPMRRQGGGQIINISSMASKQGAPYLAVYCASKAAVSVLSEAVAGEVRNDNIKVSVLMPGSTDTGFMTHMGRDHKPSRKDKPRLTAADVAEAILFLAKQNKSAWTSLADIRPLMLRN